MMNVIRNKLDKNKLDIFQTSFLARHYIEYKLQREHDPL